MRAQSIKSNRYFSGAFFFQLITHSVELAEKPSEAKMNDEILIEDLFQWTQLDIHVTE